MDYNFGFLVYNIYQIIFSFGRKIDVTPRILHNLCHVSACKNHIKFNDRLTMNTLEVRYTTIYTQNRYRTALMLQSRVLRSHQSIYYPDSYG